MKKINFRGVSETLSEKEMKNVVGGSEGAAWFSCRCNSDGPNPPYRSSWIEKYDDPKDMGKDIKLFCKTGVNCAFDKSAVIVSVNTEDQSMITIGNQLPVIIIDSDLSRVDGGTPSRIIR